MLYEHYRFSLYAAVITYIESKHAYVKSEHPTQLFHPWRLKKSWECLMIQFSYPLFQKMLTSGMLESFCLYLCVSVPVRRRYGTLLTFRLIWNANVLLTLLSVASTVLLEKFSPIRTCIVQSVYSAVSQSLLRWGSPGWTDDNWKHKEGVEKRPVSYVLRSYLLISSTCDQQHCSSIRRRHDVCSTLSVA